MHKNLASIYDKQEMHDESIEEERASLEALLSERRPSDEFLLKIALLHQHLGKRLREVEQFEAAILILEKLQTDESITLSQCLKEAAEIYAQQGNISAAVSKMK